MIPSFLNKIDIIKILNYIDNEFKYVIYKYKFILHGIILMSKTKIYYSYENSNIHVTC